MKKLSLFVVVCLGLFLGLSTEQSQELEKLRMENAALKERLGPPPSSLDMFYPPKAEMPVYQIKMLELAGPMNGIIVNLLEGDMANVMPNFEGFKALYASLAEMVPEWAHLWPTEPVNELGSALQSRDQSQVMAAFEKMGAVCYDCHVNNMVKVQHRYHWPDFQEVSISDPLTEEKLNFPRIMQNLDLSFMSIMVNLQEGQIENAVKNFEGFNARFQALKDVCGDCHGTSERKYFIDKDVQDTIDKLGQSLKNPATLNPDDVQGLMMRIGEESCGKCHLVHVPAAMSQLQWK